MPGLLIAFEGSIRAASRRSRSAARPPEGRRRDCRFDYATSIGGRSPGPCREAITTPTSCSSCKSPTATNGRPICSWIDGGSSSCATATRRPASYGEAQGMRPGGRCRSFAPPALTILLDIAPETAAAARPSIATTSAIALLVACAKAIAARLRPVYSSSTPSGARTRSSTMCSAPSRHDWRLSARPNPCFLQRGAHLQHPPVVHIVDGTIAPASAAAERRGQRRRAYCAFAARPAVPSA